MKIYAIPENADQPAAFEVSNITLSRTRACRIVEAIPGAQILKRPAAFSWFREPVFCKFELDGQKFEIEEPFGDSSRFWIGPASTGNNQRILKWHPATDKVRHAFSFA